MVRGLRLLLFCALSLLAVACSGGQRPTVSDEPLPTPRPAPPLVGEAVEVLVGAIAAQPVALGLESSATIELRGLPGVEQPVIGEVEAGTLTERVGEGFKTEDDLVWWQVRSGALLGWTSELIGYRGPAEVVTESVQAALGEASFATAEDAAQAAFDQVATDFGVSDVVVIGTTEIPGQNSVTLTSDLMVADGPVAGWRIVVATGATDGLWKPVSITQFVLCADGVTAEGTCG